MRGVVSIADIFLLANTAQVFLTTENTEDTENFTMLGEVGKSAKFTTPK